MKISVQLELDTNNPDDVKQAEETLAFFQKLKTVFNEVEIDTGDADENV